MRGLLAYADDDSDSESTIQVPQNARKHHDIENGSSVAGTTSKEKEHSNNHHKSKAGSSKLFASDGRAAQVVIRRPPTLRERPRAHISADDSTNSPRGQSSSIRSSSQPHDSGSPSHLSTSNEGTPAPHGGEIDTEQQQLARMRALLRPPPIPGLEDWGIPPPSTDPVDPQIAAKLANFHALKHPPPGSSNQPKHFNDSLMSNRSFRNPHLYSTLLDWTGMSEEDEKTTNFPKEIWDLDEIKNKKEWYADNVGAWLRNGLNTGTTQAQKLRAEKQAAAQSSGKRSAIDFTSSSSTAAASSSSRHSLPSHPSNFTSHSTTSSSRHASRRDRDRPSSSSNPYLSHSSSSSNPYLAHSAGKKGRYQPYGSGGGERERGKTRWG